MRRRDTTFRARRRSFFYDRLTASAVSRAASRWRLRFLAVRRRRFIIAPSSAVPVCSRGQQPAFAVKKQFSFTGNIGARKQLISLSMTVQDPIKWRGFHQLSILRASFLPAFWLATPSGRLFPPDVGPEPAGAPAAMILKDRNAPTTSRSAAEGNAQGLIW